MIREISLGINGLRYQISKLFACLVIWPLPMFTQEGTIGLLFVCLSVCPSYLSVCCKQDISKAIQASLKKLGMLTDGNVLIMHVILFP